MKIASDFGRRNDRQRVAWVAREIAKLPAGWRVIDIGAGELRFKPYCSHLRYVAQDFGRYDGKGDGLGLQMGRFDQSGIDIVSDLTAIPEPDGSFDAALCTEVLEHVPDPLAAVREMARLLRPGGRLILTAPFISFTHFSPYHFHTGFSRYWHEHWLPRYGFRILRLEPADRDGFFELLAQELDRAPSVWRSYTTAIGPLVPLVASLLRAASAAVRELLRFCDARSRASEDLCTYRWCCVAERVVDSAL